jgi:hypothetical protein
MRENQIQVGMRYVVRVSEGSNYMPDGLPEGSIVRVLHCGENLAIVGLADGRKFGVFTSCLHPVERPLQELALETDSPTKRQATPFVFYEFFAQK